MPIPRFLKTVLRTTATCIAVFGLLYYLDYLEVSQESSVISENETLIAEEALVQSALKCCYPDEEFKRSITDNFAGAASTSPEMTGEQKDNWYVDYHADYRAIFINLGSGGVSNSVDIYDELTTRKENLAVNNAPESNHCISIWLVSPYGRYDVVWFDEDIVIDKRQLKDGFAIHLNFQPEA